MGKVGPTFHIRASVLGEAGFEAYCINLWGNSYCLLKGFFFAFFLSICLLLLVTTIMASLYELYELLQECE